MIRTITALFIAVLFCFVGTDALNAASVDVTLKKNVDVTGDGKADQIQLRVKGNSYTTPFFWTLTIFAGGNEIYSYSSHDKDADELFSYYFKKEECKDYLDCKKKYYFHDILNRIVIPKTGYDIDGITNRSFETTLYHVGGAYLSKCCGIAGKQAESILSAMETRIRNGSAILISVPYNPVKDQPPMMYAPEVERFIPVYLE
jgi:hypothetical protein